MTLREIFMKFLEAHSIPWGELNLEPEAPNQLYILMQGENKNFEGHALFLEEEGLFLFYTLLDAQVPQGRREEIAYKLLNLNYGLKAGCFYMEKSTGMLTVRAMQYMRGADWEKQELMEKVVTECGQTADYYYPEVMRWAFG